MNTGVNPANQNVHVRIGARSEFAAVIPKYKERTIAPVNGAAPPNPNFEAASAYFGSRFRVTSIWTIPEAAQVLVTGNAAVIAASEGKLKLKENHDQPVAEQKVVDAEPVIDESEEIQITEPEPEVVTNP